MCFFVFGQSLSDVRPLFWGLTLLTEKWHCRLVEWLLHYTSKILWIGYGGFLLHAWQFQGKWRHRSVIHTQKRYFKALLIRLRMEYCEIFSITTCSHTKITWFEFVNDWVEDENVPGNGLELPDPVRKIENRYECTGKNKGCKIHEDNCRSKSEKDNIEMSKEQSSHVLKVFVEHILREFVSQVSSDILHWYNAFGDKVYLWKKTFLFYYWYEKLIISVCKWF